ncbi:leydig cell tumor 10 kDa protein homolog [Biomphalaria glabrata]|uniref:Leydig cell tumor 10 kDa protein homolog n=2 Tax=Biomphalaria TaxID=6525 RepID=A0A9W2YF88_BIOGL|nr:leydig cell tumor 10 kDa protein homolog [Biomphalaria glabrata]KAI8753492.1 hypothetical protein BgiMline_014047 [Biomphalaria glabrata]KAK0057278.1 UPF0390 protein [Biomphalaria pfeifferi]
MAQGKYKPSKIQVPGKKKEKKNKNKGVLKKGHILIAPKKAKLVEAAKLKKDLEKGIRACIEEELTAKTVSLEPRSLAMLKSSTSKTASTSSKKK